MTALDLKNQNNGGVFGEQVSGPMSRRFLHFDNGDLDKPNAHCRQGEGAAFCAADLCQIEATFGVCKTFPPPAI